MRRVFDAGVEVVTILICEVQFRIVSERQTIDVYQKQRDPSLSFTDDITENTIWMDPQLREGISKRNNTTIARTSEEVRYLTGQVGSCYVTIVIVIVINCMEGWRESEVHIHI